MKNKNKIIKNIRSSNNNRKLKKPNKNAIKNKVKTKVAVVRPQPKEPIVEEDDSLHEDPEHELEESAEDDLNSDQENSEEQNNTDEYSEDDASEGVKKDTKSPVSKTTDPKKVKPKKRGIIYISSIPKYMNVAIAKSILENYGAIGRVFFQPATKNDDDDNNKKSKKKPRRQIRHFSEGWVEFERKRAAKQIAVRLNNTPIATRKSSKFYDRLWTMKYLPRFKWVHLSERLTYEKAAYKQKLQAEISQARKEASFFQENLDRSERNKKQKKKVQ